MSVNIVLCIVSLEISFFWGGGGVLFFVLHVIKGSVQKVQAG